MTLQGVWTADVHESLKDFQRTVAGISFVVGRIVELQDGEPMMAKVVPELAQLELPLELFRELDLSVDRSGRVVGGDGRRVPARWGQYLEQAQRVILVLPGHGHRSRRAFLRAALPRRST